MKILVDYLFGLTKIHYIGDVYKISIVFDGVQHYVDYDEDDYDKRLSYSYRNIAISIEDRKTKIKQNYYIDLVDPIDAKNYNLDKINFYYFTYLYPIPNTNSDNGNFHIDMTIFNEIYDYIKSDFYNDFTINEFINKNYHKIVSFLDDLYSSLEKNDISENINDYSTPSTSNVVEL